MFIKSASLPTFITTANLYFLLALRTIAGRCIVLFIITQLGISIDKYSFGVDQYSAKTMRYRNVDIVDDSIPLRKGIGLGLFILFQLQR